MPGNAYKPFAKLSKRTVGNFFLKYSRNCFRSFAGSAALGTLTSAPASAVNIAKTRTVANTRRVGMTSANHVLFFAGLSLVVAPCHFNFVARFCALYFDLDERILRHGDAQIRDGDVLAVQAENEFLDEMRGYLFLRLGVGPQARFHGMINE